MPFRSRSLSALRRPAFPYLQLLPPPPYLAKPRKPRPAAPNPYPSNASWSLSLGNNCSGAALFYTTDGSQPTEASKYGGTGFSIYQRDTTPGVQAIAVRMQPSGSIPGVSVQNGQASSSNFKTVLASTQSQSQPYISSYRSPTPSYCATQYCTDGVQGIPTAISFVSDGSVSFPSASLTGGSTGANLNFTTAGLEYGANGTYPASTQSPNTPNGTQVLWPYNTGNGCDSCNSMVQDFYIWPQFTSSINPGNVQNWEMDLEAWNATNRQWLGAALQCSVIDNRWEYAGQGGTWKTLPIDANGDPIHHDCPLPFGTLSPGMAATDTQFVVTPANSNATVEPGMILMVDNEEIFCQAVSGNTCSTALRGYGGTTAAAHLSGARWMGSVHVQYHATLPGDGNAYIDYLNLNYYPGLNGNSALNHYDFRQIYGTQTLPSGTQVSNVKAVGAVLQSGYPDRVFDQKQIDVAPGISAQVGEFIDQDNVTINYGIMSSVSSNR